MRLVYQRTAYASLNESNVARTSTCVCVCVCVCVPLPVIEREKAGLGDRKAMVQKGRYQLLERISVRKRHPEPVHVEILARNLNELKVGDLDTARQLHLGPAKHCQCGWV